MAQIIDEYRGLGSALGTGLGQGLGSGLQTLANMKLNQMAQRESAKQAAKSYEKFGVPSNIAEALAGLSPEERKLPLQNLGALLQLNQGQQPQSAAATLQGFGQAPQQQPTPVQPVNDQAKLIESLFTSPQEKREQEKLALRKQQLNSQEKLLALRETKKYVETLKDKEKAAKESDLRLNRMIKLVERGKLPNAGLWSFLTKVEELGPVAAGGAGALLGSIVPGVGHAAGAALGGIAGALSSPLAGAAKSLIKTGSPDVEEFEKLSADFVKNAKQYFGSRLTDADLRIFMQTLPTLMQTDAGKKKVIENLGALNELSEIEAKAARAIIKENGGIPPLDIEQQVKDRVSDKLDAVAKRFIGQ